MEWFYKRTENATVDNFTSNFGLKFRRFNHKFYSATMRLIHKNVFKYDLIVERKVKLAKKKSYIFAPSHYFYFDILSINGTVDRNSYMLSGGLRTIPKATLFLGWLNGGIYVNRLDKNSRKDSIKKMGRVLNAGNSIVIYPEGVFNNSKNQLCLKLYSGVYNISFENKVEVVPVSLYKDDEKRIVYVSYGSPLKLYDYDKDEGLQILRDNIATLLYEQIEKYSIPLDRKKINGDINYYYMNKRLKEYVGDGWKDTPVWESELADFRGNDIDLEDVWKDIDKVNINLKNANIFADILVELENRKKYDFKNYVIKNYEEKNKNIENS